MSEERQRECIRIAELQREFNKEREDLDNDIRMLNNAIPNLKSQIFELERRERSLETPSIPLGRSRRRRRNSDEEGAQLQIELQRSRQLVRVQSELRNLRRQLRRHESELQTKTRERDDKIRNIYEMERRYAANNCSDFPETVPLSRRSA